MLERKVEPLLGLGYKRGDDSWVGMVAFHHGDLKESLLPQSDGGKEAIAHAQPYILGISTADDSS